MQIKTIAIIGAGTTGRGIAYASALGGYTTVLEEVSDSMLAEALSWIRESLDEGVRRGKVESAARDAALARITTSQVVDEAIRDAEVIIEAVPEELEMKLELFTIFDKFAKPNAIFASNTSSLSISDFSDIVLHRERCIGMRFFNPVPKSRLVEIVRTPQTSDETVTACVAVATRMGKETVVINEVPGFTASSIKEPQNET
jgi:3-hydroxybutyryl-CoA dehydrogenase